MNENKKEKETAVTETKPKKIALTAEFGTVYIKTMGNTIMRPIKADLTLYEKAGQIYRVRDDFAITNEGYNLLNKVASISIVTPQKVTVDEREQPNPYIERNPKTKLLETVNIRKIGVGYSPAGNITVVDKTLLYNLYAYFIESIQAKMKRVVWKSGKPTKEKKHPNCAILGTADEKPEKGRWAFYETVPPLGLWINIEDPAIIDCLNEHTQKQRFGDRIAQTIVERNIMKSHPAIGISRVQPMQASTTNEHKATTTVYGFRHELKPQDIDDILLQAERGSKVIATTAEVIETVDEEEEAQAMQEVEEDEKLTPKKTKKKEEATEEKSPAEMKEPPPEFYKDKEKEDESKTTD